MNESMEFGGGGRAQGGRRRGSSLAVPSRARIPLGNSPPVLPGCRTEHRDGDVCVLNTVWFFGHRAQTLEATVSLLSTLSPRRGSPRRVRPACGPPASGVATSPAPVASASGALMGPDLLLWGLQSPSCKKINLGIRANIRVLFSLWISHLSPQKWLQRLRRV